MRPTLMLGLPASRSPLCPSRARTSFSDMRANPVAYRGSPFRSEAGRQYSPTFVRKRCGLASCILLLTFVIGVAKASVASAQSIQGVLVEIESRQPLEGAMVVLLDLEGATPRSTLTDADGRFLLNVPDPGQYALRVDRIGYESVTSPMLTVRSGEVLRYNMEIEVRPISLRAISVVAEEPRCGLRPRHEASQTVRVWEEARKALAATHWLQKNRRLRFEGETFVRNLDPGNNRVLEESYRPYRGYSSQPFTSLPAEDLATHGYVRAVSGGRYFDFVAPSAEVLLSDAFLSTHCLQVVEGTHVTEGLIGVAFQPLRDRRVPDIQGTFWLDASSAELRYLEFIYTGVDARIPVEESGGRVDFATLADGTWIISNWVIRTPVTGQERVGWMGSSRVRTKVVSVREKGGEITRTFGVTGEPIDRATRTRIVGTVFDSTAAAPLAGARVRLSGTARVGVTDVMGRFHISDVPGGTYALEFWHPRLDSLPLAALPLVDIVTGGEAEVSAHLAIPPLSRILVAACPPEAAEHAISRRRPDESSVLVGSVYDPLTQQPVADATVAVTWTESGLEAGTAAAASGRHVVTTLPFSASTRTTETGRFWLCHLPRGVPLHASVALPNGGKQQARFRLDEDVQTLSIGTGSAMPESRNAADSMQGAADASVAILNIATKSSATHTSALSGRVFNRATGEPIPDAVVGVGDERQTTDEGGAFRFRSLSPGRIRVEIQHIAYGVATVDVGIESGVEATVVIRIAHQGIVLDPLAVSTRAERDRQWRYSTTRRDFLDSEQLTEARLRGQTLVDVLRRFPGLTLQQGTFTTTTGVVSGICVISSRRIASLRPSSGGSSGAPYCESVPVVVDGAVVGMPIEFLRTVRLDDFQTIEFVGALDGAVRYGQAAASAGGALLFSTH